MNQRKLSLLLSGFSRVTGFSQVDRSSESRGQWALEDSHNLKKAARVQSSQGKKKSLLGDSGRPKLCKLQSGCLPAAQASQGSAPGPRLSPAAPPPAQGRRPSSRPLFRPARAPEVSEHVIGRPPTCWVFPAPYSEKAHSTLEASVPAGFPGSRPETTHLSPRPCPTQ